MREKPFENIKDFNKFREYCYTVFGLHFVGDTMTKHTVMDGDAIVKQIRESAETINDFIPIVDAVVNLSYFIKEDGSLQEGFYTKELLLKLRGMAQEKKIWLVEENQNEI